MPRVAKCTMVSTVVRSAYPVAVARRRRCVRLRPPPRLSYHPVAAGMAAYHDTKFEDLRAFDDVKPFLSALLEARIRTGIITHGWTTKQSEKLIRLGLVPLLPLL